MKINNIHCLALNYKGVGEINQDPIYFLKSTSCLAYEESEVKYPKFNTTEVWTEVELGIFISEDCENINEEEAHNYIGGFFIAGDITCSNLYNRDHHLASSKARTGFCPISTNIFNIDLLNIDAFLYKIHSLIKMKLNSKAKKQFNYFVNNYSKITGDDFNMTYRDVINRVL